MEKRYCENCGSEVEPGSCFCENCGAKIEQIHSVKFVQKNKGTGFLSKKSTRIVCGTIGVIALVLGGYQGWKQSQDNQIDLSTDSIGQDNVVEGGENFDPRIAEVTEDDAIETVRRVIYGGRGEDYRYELDPLGYFAFEVKVYKNGVGLIGDYMFDRETFEVSEMKYGN